MYHPTPCGPFDQRILYLVEIAANPETSSPKKKPKNVIHLGRGCIRSCCSHHACFWADAFGVLDLGIHRMTGGADGRIP